MHSDAYVPLAQTSITSAYANGAQATYTLRFDTDLFNFFYLCLIRVNHRSSVVPRGGKAPHDN